VFKGSGFYSTDNRSTSGLATPKPEKNEKSDKGESETKTKVETKTGSEKKE